jgi:immune inhibitor A
VEFSDIKNQFTENFGDYVEKLMNGNDPINGNISSVNRFIKDISNGKVNYECDVIGPVRLSNPRTFYDRPGDLDNEAKGTVEFIEDSIRTAISSGKLQLQKYAEDGVVIAMNFGYAGTQPNYPDYSLWPHSFNYEKFEIEQPWKNEPQQASIAEYQMTNMGLKLQDLVIGTMVHENSHMLFRFPDLYDSDYSSSGLGPYCLMAAGSRAGLGKRPCNANAFLRERTGWYDQRIELNGMNGALDIEHNFTKVYKYTCSKNEFFILEARLKREHDTELPAEGLAIYHVDTNQKNNMNESQTAEDHYLISLIQADGKQELEASRGAQGDQGDLFVSGQVINDPKLWSGHSSGLAVKILNVDRSTGIIKVFIGNEGGIENSVTKKSTIPNEIIPDGFKEGIRNSIQIPETGICVSAKVSINITHSKASDLSVILISPSGKKHTIVKPDPTGKRQDFNPITNMDLSDTFRDTEINGFWVLNVADFATQDVGTLNNWSLNLVFK